jgi:NTP pyrophosphatase (non-canonical NTP hydrolase)
MQTEALVPPAHQWLKERPTLAKEQLGTSPVFDLLRAREEIDELLQAVKDGADRQDVMQELADVMNFIACAEDIICREYGITAEEIEQEAKWKYTRNGYKYPKEGYQNGVPPKEQLKTDANNFMLATIYYAVAEYGLNPEYY